MTATTLIGDLIGSRSSDDRRALHVRFEHALAEVNELFSPPTPMRMQAGDEYQGVFATLGDALCASLLVRLALQPDGDIRHGIGRGDVEVLATSPRVEDGPGWWAARAAIDQVKQAEGTPAMRSLRTAYVAAIPPPAGDPAISPPAVDPAISTPAGSQSADASLVNASLVLRDQLVSGLSPRSLSVLRGLLAQQTQRDLAEELGISPSAVSQRVRADGLGSIVAAYELMGGLA